MITTTKAMPNAMSYEHSTPGKKKEEPAFQYDRVMLVDDDELDNFLSEKILVSNFFAKKVFVNRSGRAALEAFKIMCIKPEYAEEILPQVFFIDKTMPAIDGIELIELFELMCPAVIEKRKIVLMSACFSENDRKRVEKLKTKVVLMNKPITRLKLEALK